jgi:hypothetical protein
MAFSPDGQAFAWCNGEALIMARLEAATGRWTIKWRSEEAKRTAFIAFSPKSTFLASWEVSNDYFYLPANVSIIIFNVIIPSPA